MSAQKENMNHVIDIMELSRFEWAHVKKLPFPLVSTYFDLKS